MPSAMTVLPDRRKMLVIRRCDGAPPTAPPSPLLETKIDLIRITTHTMEELTNEQIEFGEIAKSLRNDPRSLTNIRTRGGLKDCGPLQKAFYNLKEPYVDPNYFHHVKYHGFRPATLRDLIRTINHQNQGSSRADRYLRWIAHCLSFYPDQDMELPHTGVNLKQPNCDASTDRGQPTHSRPSGTPVLRPFNPPTPSGDAALFLAHYWAQLANVLLDNQQSYTHQLKWMIRECRNWDFERVAHEDDEYLPKFPQYHFDLGENMRGNQEEPQFFSSCDPQFSNPLPEFEEEKRIGSDQETVDIFNRIYEWLDGMTSGPTSME
ncbi:unnamed protein product [Caenorhabditis auriculariae]|uniref:Uncharacterized protein n=1 Tax=Caenorhabditis auriculariae TaxID=2777116 RepID=A0A8S1HDP4_9PELO|nr:unnamed protein product [Caenorhabditis auriculariae]